MPRVKRGKGHLKRRKNLLKKTKGYMWGRKNRLKLAKTAILKAGVYAYRDRRRKKRDMRGLQILKINAAARANGESYSKFIKKLKDAKIELDRKILAQIAEKYPNVFKKIVEEAK